MRYGALPIVHHTGGLIDTVPEFTPGMMQGHGFVFRDYATAALIMTVKKATDSFVDRKAWSRAVQRVMRLDLSWQVSAAKYEAAYRLLPGL